MGRRTGCEKGGLGKKRVREGRRTGCEKGS